MTRFVFEVYKENEKERLDSFVDACFESESDDVKARFSRSYIQKLIENGNITVNGRERKKSFFPKAGDIVVVDAPDEQLDILPQDIPLDIVYEDDSLLVANKPKGMVVHPAPGNPDGTLVNALLFHCEGSLSGINGVHRPGIVHRIDKDTSGLLVVAKNDLAHLSLSEQVAAHSMTRVYNAVVHGRFSDERGTIDLPIGRSENDRKKFCVKENNSRHAVTHFEVVTQYERFADIRVRLETGRTHQIRVHMAHISHPIAGDIVYGPKGTPKGLNGQCLHAGKLGFVHPVTNEYMEFEAEMPDYYKNFLKTLR